MNQEFSDHQIEATIVLALRRTLGPSADNIPAPLMQALINQPQTRDKAILRLQARTLALSMVDSLSADGFFKDPKHAEQLAKFRQHEADEAAYIANKYGTPTSPPTEATHGTPTTHGTPETTPESAIPQLVDVMEKGVNLMRSMDGGAIPTDEQMERFVRDFLALPGQRDALIEDFFKAQDAMQTAEKALNLARNEAERNEGPVHAELAKRELVGALRKRHEALGTFKQAEFLLRETLTHAGELVEGDPATRTLTGTRLQVRATKSAEGILYLLLERVEPSHG